MKINIMSGVGAMGISNLCQLVLAPVMLYYLGAENYGLWATLASLLVIGQFGDQGVGDALIRYVSMAHSRKNYSEIGQYVSTALSISLCLGLLTVLSVATFHRSILQFMNVESGLLSTATQLLFALLVLLLLFLVKIITNATLAGLGRIDLRNVILITGRIIQLPVTLVCLVGDLGIWAIWWGQFAFHIISVLAGIFMIKKITGENVIALRGFHRNKAREMAGMGSYMLLSRLLQLGHQPLMRIILSRYLGLEYVTFFDIANKAVRMIRSLASAGIKAIVPRVSAAETEGLAGLAVVNRITQKLTLGIFVVITPLYVLLFMLGGYAFQFWLGNNYHPEMLVALRYLLPVSLANILVVPAYYAFIGWGRTDLSAQLAGLSLFFFAIGIGVNIQADWIYHFQIILIAYGLSYVLPAMIVPFMYFRVQTNKKFQTITDD